MKEKIKIAFIHPNIDEINGGSEIFCKTLSTKLLQEGYSIKIISNKTLMKSDNLFRCISKIDVSSSEKIVVSIIFKLFSYFTKYPEILTEFMFFFPNVLKDLLINDYDILYPHNTIFGLIPCYITRMIKKTPIVYTEHASAFPAVYNKNLFFKPDLYIAPNSYFLNKISDRCPFMNIRLIYNGINNSSFRNWPNYNDSLDKKYFKFDNNYKTVLSIGRLDANKRMSLIIQAVSELKNINLLIIGDGEELNFLSKLGHSLLDKTRFKIIQSCDYNEIPYYYHLCDVFTLPSKCESFGLVYIEAMACNKPIVATNDSIRAEIIGDGGILCDVENSHAYAEAIENSLSQSWYQKPMKQAAKFDLEQMVNDYKNEFNNLIKKF